MKKSTRNIILICLVLLAGCFTIKLFHSEYFRVFTTNGLAHKFMMMMCNNKLMKTVIYLPLYLIANGLYMLAVLKQKFFKVKQLIIFILITSAHFTVWLFSQKFGIYTYYVYVVIAPLLMGAKIWRIGAGAGVDYIILWASDNIKAHKGVFEYVMNPLCWLISSLDIIIMYLILYLFSNNITLPTLHLGKKKK